MHPWIWNSLNSNELSAPPFLGDALAWQREFVMLEAFDGITDFCKKIQKSTWYAELPRSVILYIEDRILRAGFLRQAVKSEFETAATAFAKAEIPALLMTQISFEYVNRKVHFLVPESHYYPAIDILGRTGFRSRNKKSDLKLGFELYRSNAGIRIQVSRAVAKQDSLTDIEAIWIRSKVLPILNHPRTVRIASETDRLAAFMNDAIVDDQLRSLAKIKFVSDWVSSQSAKIDYKLLESEFTRRSHFNGAQIAFWLAQGLYAAPLNSSSRDSWLQRQLKKSLHSPKDWFERGGSNLFAAVRTQMLLKDEPKAIVEAIRSR